MIPLGDDNERYELLLGTLYLYKFALRHYMHLINVCTIVKSSDYPPTPSCLHAKLDYYYCHQ